MIRTKQSALQVQMVSLFS